MMFRLILLNKLLEDGNTLYRQAALGEASTRYRYAVRRLPREGGVVPPAFTQLHTHLLLNLSRCERRRGQFSEAATLASQVSSAQTFLTPTTTRAVAPLRLIFIFPTQVLSMRPDCVEGLVARAKAHQAAGRAREALQDFTAALHLAPARTEIRYSPATFLLCESGQARL